MFNAVDFCHGACSRIVLISRHTGLHAVSALATNDCVQAGIMTISVAWAQLAREIGQGFCMGTVQGPGSATVSRHMLLNVNDKMHWSGTLLIEGM